jgi:hypothetical protein
MTDFGERTRKGNGLDGDDPAVDELAGGDLLGDELSGDDQAEGGFWLGGISAMIDERPFFWETNMSSDQKKRPFRVNENGREDVCEDIFASILINRWLLFFRPEKRRFCRRRLDVRETGRRPIHTALDLISLTAADAAAVDSRPPIFCVSKKLHIDLAAEWMEKTVNRQSMLRLTPRGNSLMRHKGRPELRKLTLCQ